MKRFLNFLKRIKIKKSKLQLTIPVLKINLEKQELNEVKKNCLNCRFNTGDFCIVGSYYAEEHGSNTFCYEGELWENKIQNNLISQ